MRLHGVGLGRALVVGPVKLADAEPSEPVVAVHAGDAGAELARVDEALRAVAAEITDYATLADSTASEMLSAAAMMASDPTVRDDIERRVRSGLVAERAVFEAFEEFRSGLLAAGGRPAESAVDLRDVQRRVIARLSGAPMSGQPYDSSPDLLSPHIVVATDLAPAQFVALDTASVLGIVTEHGGPTSHTAILARAASIPALVGVTGAAAIVAGSTVILDAASGTLTVDPSSHELAAARTRGAASIPGVAAVVPLRPGALADGTRIPLLANLDSPDQSRQALELGAEGVGLFRSEIAFLDHANAPSIASLTAEYRRLLDEFEGRPVTIRLFDSSADKPLRFLAAPEGQNPALGVKGLRALRAHEPVLADQFDALAEAGAAIGADLWVMAPMVTDAEDAAWVVDLGHRAGLAKVGVVAEVPSLALCAAEVVEVVDFVSIGTNDLTQYTMAADRTMAGLASYQDAWHPAVLRLVRMLADAGAAHHTPVGVCGEAAADPLLATVLVGLGVTSLSMAPSAFADVRTQLSVVTLAQARVRASAALGARSSDDARAAAARA
jgi:phosphotransferase system enzyme I (PtsI)